MSNGTKTTDVAIRDNQALQELSMEELENAKKSLPEFCKPFIENAEERFRRMSAQLPNAVNVFLASKARDTYKVVGDYVLQRGKDGYYYAVLRDKEGQILEHVKLEKSVSDLACATAIAWSAISAATGQAFMMKISEQLEEIGKQLEELKELKYTEIIAKINITCETLGTEVRHISDEDHRRQILVLLRNDLKGYLQTLRGYIMIDIKNMPEYHKKTWWEKLWGNWGTEKSMLTSICCERFEYIERCFPVWYRGMVFLMMTDPYVEQTEPNSQQLELQSAKDLLDGLHDMLEIGKLPERVLYVPKMEDCSDPYEQIKELKKRLPEMEQNFKRVREGNLLIPTNDKREIPLSVN